jgi:hypothetical protein
MQDCRECSYFRWDFELGSFVCENARNWQVEELHLIPEWCPLNNNGLAAASTKNTVHKQSRNKRIKIYD